MANAGAKAERPVSEHFCHPTLVVALKMTRGGYLDGRLPVIWPSGLLHRSISSASNLSHLEWSRLARFTELVKGNHLTRRDGNYDFGAFTYENYFARIQFYVA